MQNRKRDSTLDDRPNKPRKSVHRERRDEEDTKSADDAVNPWNSKGDAERTDRSAHHEKACHTTAMPGRVHISPVMRLVQFSV
jgi:hypothetical protein